MEIMDCVSPVGPVYQAGTLSGNPLAMAAGLAMLKYLNQHPEIYTQLQDSTTYLVEGIRQQLKSKGHPFTINQVGSMFTLFFTNVAVSDYHSALTSDTGLFAKYFQQMLSQGIYLAPSQFEAMFVSAAIDRKIADRILEASENALNNIL